MYLSDKRANALLSQKIGQPGVTYEDSELYAKLLRALKNDELVIQDESLSLSFVMELVTLILVGSFVIGSGVYYVNKTYLMQDDDKTLRKRFIDSHEEEHEIKACYHLSKQ